ncbi:MAG: DUF255 domain-containing protein [Saprospiraceae bacterium]|nr:DUF255 domain-containing protein [Saprospiraceae bacterium]
MKFLLLSIISITVLSFSNPNDPVQEPPVEGIQWLTWEDAVKANGVNKKKLFVDVYTDWCGWCKVMDRKTFSDPAIVEYMNEHFYAVKLDAEQKEPIMWNDKEFKWVKSGRNGVHTLAYSLLDGKMSYPSFVFLTEDFERIRISKGFKEASAFIEELQFAGEEKYKKSQSGS